MSAPSWLHHYVGFQVARLRTTCGREMIVGPVGVAAERYLVIAIASERALHDLLCDDSTALLTIEMLAGQTTGMLAGGAGPEIAVSTAFACMIQARVPLEGATLIVLEPLETVENYPESPSPRHSGQRPGRHDTDVEDATLAMKMAEERRAELEARVAELERALRYLVEQFTDGEDGPFTYTGAITVTMLEQARAALGSAGHDS